ncbi:chemotaxis protein CheW [Cohnella yongneupensis]|uniref:Chemotaxis protein CheW n=1 Tax=Cohnella yongneupensis TaxID=425006 RepID=A0ABW0QZG6_9BACL
MSDHIVIGLNEMKYGLAIAEIQEIIKILPITDIPNVPHYIEGVINLRGTIVPVIGLRARFQLPAREADASSRIVIVNTAAAEEAIGLLVDNVMQVVPFEEVLPAPDGVGGGDQSYVKGIGKLDGQLISLLDLSKVLGMGENGQ